MNNINIGIVSLGLIGGSILKSLYKKYNLYAVSSNPQTREKLKAYTSNISDDLSLLKQCDLVFVCSPMSKTVKMLDSLENILKPETIVADVCSLKEFVTKKHRPYIFIGTHPMAGTENSGFDSSFAELFQGATWVLTPDDMQKTKDEESLNLLSSVIMCTGARTIYMNAKEHDRAVSLISHMPMLVSQSLVKIIMNDKNAAMLASSGFRDMTRLALSNIHMADDMIEMNKKNIEDSLNTLFANSNFLLKSDYLNEIEKIKEFRNNMYDKEGKNIYN